MLQESHNCVQAELSMEILNTWNQHPEAFLPWIAIPDETRLKTKHNQNNGYQGGEVVQSKQKQTCQEQRSWQQFIEMLKGFFACWVSGGPKNDDICLSWGCFEKVSQNCSRKTPRKALPESLPLPQHCCVPAHFSHQTRTVLQVSMGKALHIHLTTVLIWLLLTSFCCIILLYMCVYVCVYVHTLTHLCFSSVNSVT